LLWAPRRGGFSLLEMLLAIGLIVLLFGGVFVFYQYAIGARTATQQSAEEAQLARAVMEQMADDLKAVPATSAMIQQLVAARGGIKGAAKKAGGDTGMAGGADHISFQTSRCVPIGRMMQPTVTGPQVQDPTANRPPVYDLQDVQWYWSYDATTNTSGGLYRTYRPSVTPPPLPADAIGDQPADASGNPAGGDDASGDLLGDTAAAAPPDPLLVGDDKPFSLEVKWIYVRYYDGSTWTDSFDGTGGKLPRAVEITIGFEPVLTAEQFASGTTLADRFAKLFGDAASEALPPRSYQTTVYLAAGDAVTKEVRIQK